MHNIATFRDFAFVIAKQFDREVVDVLGAMPRADEFIRGVEWILSRNPEEGRLVVADPHFIRVVFCGVNGYSDIGVYYAVRGEHVHLLSIHNEDGE